MLSAEDEGRRLGGVNPEVLDVGLAQEMLREQERARLHTFHAEAAANSSAYASAAAAAQASRNYHAAAGASNWSAAMTPVDDGEAKHDILVLAPPPTEELAALAEILRQERQRLDAFDTEAGSGSAQVQAVAQALRNYQEALDPANWGAAQTPHADVSAALTDFMRQERARLDTFRAEAAANSSAYADILAAAKVAKAEAVAQASRNYHAVVGATNWGAACAVEAGPVAPIETAPSTAAYLHDVPLRTYWPPCKATALPLVCAHWQTFC
jgi:hypothetical protein